MATSEYIPERMRHLYEFFMHYISCTDKAEINFSNVPSLFREQKMYSSYSTTFFYKQKRWTSDMRLLYFLKNDIRVHPGMARDTIAAQPLDAQSLLESRLLGSRITMDTCTVHFLQHSSLQERLDFLKPCMAKDWNVSQENNDILVGKW